MPYYDYQCKNCGYRFEAWHKMDEAAPSCPSCNYAEVQRLITSAPSIARGILTHAGDGYRATKEQLQEKWQEETPKLRKKLVDKLGEATVDRMAPTLKTDD